MNLKLSSDLEMTAFESLLPVCLENQLILYTKKMKTKEAQKEEVEGILDSRIGAKIREIPIRLQARRQGSNDDMDVDAFHKGRTKSCPGS